MADGKWGHCGSCKFFGSPATAPLEEEEAPCLHPVHVKYRLTVFASNGCTGWELRPGIGAPREAAAPPM